MQLHSALGLKQELDEVFASQTRDGGPYRRRFALGVAPGARPLDYALAVRAPSPEELGQEELDVIAARSSGEIDLRYVGEITPLGHVRMAASAARLGVGGSVAHHRCSAGTLGFFARNGDGIQGFVSNNHVIAVVDEGEDGDEIVCPAPIDGGVRPRDVIAHLDGNYPKVKRARPRIDCAFARLIAPIDFDPLALDGGGRLSVETVLPEEHPDVWKIGRTTGATYGRITAFALDHVEVDFGRWALKFDGQIEIQSADGKPFSRGGDSGSLVFSRHGNHPVGLLFAASVMGGKNNAGLTYANSIDEVLTALGVTFVV